MQFTVAVFVIDGRDGILETLQRVTRCRYFAFFDNFDLIIHQRVFDIGAADIDRQIIAHGTILLIIISAVFIVQNLHLV